MRREIGWGGRKVIGRIDGPLMRCGEEHLMQQFVRVSMRC